MPDPIVPSRTDVEATTVVQLDCVCPSEPSAIAAEMSRAFAELGEFVGKHHLQPNAPPRAIYTAYGPDGVHFTLAMPIDSPTSPVTTDEAAHLSALPAGRTLRFTHQGPYAELAHTYGQITAYLKDAGLIETEADWVRFMPMWEEYVNDPDTTPETDLVTHIHLPLG